MSADTSAYSLPEAALDGTALPPRRLDARISGQVPTSTPRSQHRIRVRNRQEEDVVRSPIERKMHRILYKAQKAKEEEQLRLALTREWQTQRNEELLRPGDPDWRVILQSLKESTPQHGKWLVEAIAVTVSTKSMQRLLLGLDEDIWSVANAYDCSIKLGPRKDPSASFHTFVLSGSAVSISKTTAHLLRIVPSMQINSSIIGTKDRKTQNPKYDGFGDVQNLPGHLRYVVPADRRTTLQLREDGLPFQPIRWNKDVFYKYVFDLTHTKGFNVHPSILYHEGRSNISVIRNILHDLFANQEYKSYVTSKAIKEATNYFLNHSCIHEARAIFNNHSIKDPELFNLMLEKAGTVNDLHNFQFILNLMIRKGFLPNRATWVAFLNANKSNLQIRLAILSAMKEKGLLQHTLGLKEACRVLAISDLEISLSKLESQEEYMKQMDSKYGPDWLSSNTAHRILQVLASRGLISRSCEFLQIMESRFVKPQSIAVNTILQHCNTSRDLGGAIELMTFVPRFKDFIPDEDTYRILLVMAWQSKNLNLAKVVWKYACLSGKVVFRTRNLIHRSIWRKKPKTAQISSRIRFLSLAPQFILEGTEHPVSVVQVKRENLADSLKRETDDFMKLEPARPFEKMLQEALEMDTTWKVAQAKRGEKYDLKWMLENGINVPTRPLRGVVRSAVPWSAGQGMIRKCSV